MVRQGFAWPRRREAARSGRVKDTASRRRSPHRPAPKARSRARAPRPGSGSNSPPVMAASSAAGRTRGFVDCVATITSHDPREQLHHPGHVLLAERREHGDPRRRGPRRAPAARRRAAPSRPGCGPHPISRAVRGRAPPSSRARAHRASAPGRPACRGRARRRPGPPRGSDPGTSPRPAPPRPSRLGRERPPLRLADDEQAALGDDRQLLGGDRLARRAEELRVLERDVREHLDARSGEHVRRVEPSPRPASTTPHSTPAASNAQNAAAVSASNCVTPGAGRVAHAQHRILVRAGADLGAADPDPLAKRRDVRREVGAGADALGLEQRLGEEHRRPLAVRSDHVDGVERPLGVAEPRSRSSIRSSPKAMPNSSSESMYRSAAVTRAQPAATRAPAPRPRTAPPSRAPPRPPRVAPCS